jgi:phage terminase large subunit
VNKLSADATNEYETFTTETESAIPQRQVDWDTLLGFTVRQQSALDAMYTKRFLLYGGARGGGKSRFLRWAAVDYLVTLFQELGIKHARVGLFCETYPDLRDRQISKIRTEFPMWMGKLTDSKDQGLAFVLSDELGGGIIALRNLDDPTKYQSAEFAAIFVDELTKTTIDTFNILRGSLRWPGVSHTVFVGATNPGSIGHAWVKALWIDSIFPKEMEPLRPMFGFIQSLPADNPYLEQTYWDDLNTLPEDLRKAWVLGMWDVFEGQAFSAWGPQHIVDNFEIPIYWPRTVGIDWGYRKPFCALWSATNPQTRQVVIYDEIYQDLLTDDQQATAIKARSEEQFIRFFFADPSMWTKRSQTVSLIKSTADIYAEYGVILQKGDNDRMSGKRKVSRLLQTGPYGEPGMVVQRKCKNLIRTLPALPFDRHRIEDVDTMAEDHAYDALRYNLSAQRAGTLTERDLERMQHPKTVAMHPVYAAYKRRRTIWQ